MPGLSYMTRFPPPALHAAWWSPKLPAVLLWLKHQVLVPSQKNVSLSAGPPARRQAFRFRPGGRRDNSRSKGKPHPKGHLAGLRAR
jgi:hypothetical protein